MNVNRFLWFAALALLWSRAVQAAEPGRQPNILVIVADDLGYADIGVNGCKDVPTPHIDSIAQNGIRFTNGYVSCPVCSPTRAALLTGRYQQRFGHEFNPGPAQQADPKFGLPQSEKTFADRLKALGYATGAVGKWHLGYRSEFHPLRRGFDEFFGFLGGSHSYLNNRDTANAVQRGTTPVPAVTYTTDMFGGEAAAFIERHAKGPWFLYLAFNAVHAPMEATDSYLARVSGIDDPLRRKFAAMLLALDDNVGRVLAKLRALGLEEQTLIFFVSDNGGPTRVTSSRNTPLSGFKGQVHEGGIRVPFLVQWKGHLPAGRVYASPVMTFDILPTAVAAANGQASPDGRLDGVNLLPFLKGERGGAPHDHLCWRYGDQWAVRKGDWKLRKDAAEVAPKLFNLATDVAEQNDLAAKEPARVKALEAVYKTWNAGNEAPRWQTARARQTAR